jgi:hypothetical protein
MIAIVVSLLLALYIFIPDFLFSKFAQPFVRLKRNQRTRVEEVAAGITVAAIPFFATLVLSWKVHFFGHWPLGTSQPSAAKWSDYKYVLACLYSESFFSKNPDQFWSALAGVRVNQLRFLIWNYVFLGFEIAIIVPLTVFYGSLYKSRLYRNTVGWLLLRRVSHWQVLLTGFMFPRNSKPEIWVDVMTTDDHLFTGVVADYFVTSEGEMSGLLLKKFKRFKFKQMEDDRKKGQSVLTDNYWKEIPGANFYIPSDKIANLNIRYELPKNLLQDSLSKALLRHHVQGARVNVSGKRVTFRVDVHKRKSPPPDSAPPADSE